MRIEIESLTPLVKTEVKKMHQQQPQIVVVQESNGLGLAGFILSLLGWVTCGLLCVPGLLFSFFGLFGEKPKEFAIAGLILGLPGLLFFVIFGFWMLVGFFGLATVGSAVNEAERTREERTAAKRLAEQTPVDKKPSPKAEVIEEPKREPRKFSAREFDRSYYEPKPEPEVTPYPAPQPSASEVPVVEVKPEPKLRRRIFSDATGKFKLNALIVDYKDGWVKLRKVEDNSEIAIEAAKLSKIDQRWLEDNYGKRK